MMVHIIDFVLKYQLSPQITPNQGTYLLCKHERSGIDQMADRNGEHEIVGHSHYKTKIDRPLDNVKTQHHDMRRVKTYANMVKLRK
jgi:hypothetical protein